MRLLRPPPICRFQLSRLQASERNFERYVVKRDRLGFLELHLAALLRSFEFAELNRQSLFRPTNDF